MDEVTQKGLVYTIAGVGTLLGICGAILGIAVAAKSLMKKDVEPLPDPDKQFVTREEMRLAVTELEKRIDQFRNDLNGKMDKLSEYQGAASRENVQTLGTMALKLERLLVLREMDGQAKPKVGA